MERRCETQVWVVSQKSEKFYCTRGSHLFVLVLGFDVWWPLLFVSGDLVRTQGSKAGHGVEYYHNLQSSGLFCCVAKLLTLILTFLKVMRISNFCDQSMKKTSSHQMLH